MQSFHDELWRQPRSADDRDAVRGDHAPAHLGAGDHVRPPDAHGVGQHALGCPRRALRLHTGRRSPSTGDLTTPSRFDRVTGVTSGAPPRSVRRRSCGPRPRRRSATTGRTAGRRSPVEGRRRSSNAASTTAIDVIPTGVAVRRQQRPAVPVHLERIRPISAACPLTASAFASDAITIGDRLTINAGLRFDHSRAISQDLPALDAAWTRNRRDRPRPGHAVHLELCVAAAGRDGEADADGRTMLRASYGRFNQGVLTGEFEPFHPGATPTTTRAFDRATGDYTRARVGGRSQGQPALDRRDARAAHRRVLGRRRSRGRPPARGGDRLRPQGRRATSSAGPMSAVSIVEAARTLADGRSLPVFGSSTSRGDRRFLLTNQPTATR